MELAPTVLNINKFSIPRDWEKQYNPALLIYFFPLNQIMCIVFNFENHSSQVNEMKLKDW